MRILAVLRMIALCYGRIRLAVSFIKLQSVSKTKQARHGSQLAIAHIAWPGVVEPHLSMQRERTEMTAYADRGTVLK